MKRISLLTLSSNANRNKIYLFFFSVLFSLPSFAQIISETQKLTASDREANENFGSSVAIDGDYAIVGAREEGAKTSKGKSSEGAAYIYQKQSDGTWKEIQKLVSNNRGRNDAFGRSVAISGNLVFVGATGHEFDEAGENYIRWAGGVYVFERNANGQWIQIQKLVAPSRRQASFGSSISVDGDLLVIGAPDEKTGAAGHAPSLMTGSIYVFKKDATGKWNFEQNIMASDRKSDSYFGHSQCIQGNMIAVGAYWETSDITNQNPLKCAGAVYIYKRNSNGVWIEAQKIVASDRAATDFFGWDVNLDGRTLAVSAYRQFIGEESMHGAVYMFTLQDDGMWVETQKLRASDHGELDCFGYSIALSRNALLVGAGGDYDDVNGQNRLLESGSAYLFVQNECFKWTQVQKFTPAIRGYGAGFGLYMAIDNDIAIISAPGEETDAFQNNKINDGGAAYIFNISGMGMNPCKNAVTSTNEAIPIVSDSEFHSNEVSISIQDCKIVLTAQDQNAKYQWVKCDQNNQIIEGAIDSVFIPTETGHYAVLISKDSMTVLSNCSEVVMKETAIEIVSDELIFNINPHSNSGAFQIEVTGKITKPININITNSSGQVIHRTVLIKARTSIDIGRQPAGVYMLNVMTKNGFKKIPFNVGS